MPRAIATSGFTYWCVTTSEIGATRSSQAYAVKPTSEPATTRYAQARTESRANASAPSSLHSPKAVAPIARKTPPKSISYAVATNGSRGSESRFERKEPVDHENDAAIMIASPSAVDPAPRPGATTRPSPASPARVLRRVASAGCSPASSRMPMICSGTVPAIIAATLESIRVSATWTIPTPSVRRSSPASALPTSSARVTRRR